MLGFGRRLYELRSNNITDTVGDENCSRSEAFLGVSSNVGHTESDDEANDTAKCARD